MAINRYDTPAQAQFMNTYVPIPFDDMVKAGLMKQQLVETNDKAYGDTLAELSNVRVTPGDEPAYQEWRKKYESHLSNVLNNSKPGSYEVKREISKLRTQMALDPNLREWVNNVKTYDDAVAQRQEAEKKAVPRQNQVELDRVISTFGSTTGGGTEAWRRTTGSGIAGKAGYMEYQNYNADMDSKIKNVEEEVRNSLSPTEIDGNKYVLTSKNSYRTMQMLGAPLGIAFKVDKGKLTIDRKNSNISSYIDTNFGKQIMADAAQNVPWYREKYPDKSEAELQRMAIEDTYYGEAMKVISGRVSSKSENIIDEDAYGLLEAKKKMDDESFVFTSSATMPATPSNLTSVKVVETTKTQYEKQKNTAELELSSRFDPQGEGVREVIQSDEKGNTWIKYHDKNGKDVTNEIQQKKADIEDAEYNMNQLDEMVQGVKNDLIAQGKIPRNYVPSEKMKAEAERFADETVARQQNSRRQGTTNVFPTSQASRERAWNEAYSGYMTSKSPIYKEIDAALKENALRGGAYTGSNIRFVDEKIDNALKDFFPTALTNQPVYDARTGELITNTKTRNELANYRFEEASDRVTKADGKLQNYARVDGTQWDKERGMYVVKYDLFDKGKFKKKVMTEAPDQMVDLLIKRGLTNVTQQHVQNQISRLTTDLNQEASVSFGAKDDPAAGMVRKIRENEKYKFANGTEYVMTLMKENEVTGLNELVESGYSDPTVLGQDYEAYKRAFLEKNK